jgi:LPXTG-motif cell wall-anchored protein
VAFSASSATAPATSTTTTTVPAVHSDGTNHWIIAVAIVGGIVFLGVLIWLLRRRRRPAGTS